MFHSRSASDISEVGHPDSRRRILMLQGHPSRFWGDLADALTADGAEVHKVHFCLADVVFWGRRAATRYRGRFESWRAWLDDYLARHAITDIVYYADRFPYHVAARAAGEAAGLRCWAIEFGYLRPDWITFERGGMSGFSEFDRSPAGLKRAALTAQPPDLTPRYGYHFAQEAFCEVTFGLLATFGWPAFPNYRSDRHFWPVLDYLSWIPKLLASKRENTRAARIEARLAATRAPYFLLPMQIASDYQIRANSPYDRLDDFLHEVMTSFAAHAPAEARLVIKLHPLDSGLEGWRRRCGQLARLHGLTDRVDILRGGDLGRLLTRARGTVLVNSTVGLHALRQRVPVMACGSAIYDVPGLTHQGGLDRFWTAPDAVDPAMLGLFLRALSTIQVKGSFFDPEGRRAATRTIARRLLSADDQRASANRVRWRIKSDPPIANKTAPNKSGKAMTTYPPS